MGQKEKLLLRLKTRPKDFTFIEADALLNYLGYSRSNKGKTSGSRVVYKRENCEPITLHRPHPQKELKKYQLNQLICSLEREGLL